MVQPVLGLALVVFAGQRRPEPPSAAPAEPRTRGCVASLDAPLAATTWPLTVIDGGSSCLGLYTERTYTVSPSGVVRWEEAGTVRTFALHADELAAISGLNRYDCIRKAPPAYGERHFRLSSPGETGDGTVISGSSSMGITLAQLFDQATRRATEERVMSMGDVRLQLAARPLEQPVR